MNVVVLRGTLSRSPEVRELRSGDVVISYDLTVQGAPGASAESVPVVLFTDAATSASAAEYEADEELLVVGRVRRRFFRAGGSTQSRTEVVADKVVPTRRPKAAMRAVDTIALQAIAEGTVDWDINALEDVKAPGA